MLSKVSSCVALLSCLAVVAVNARPDIPPQGAEAPAAENTAAFQGKHLHPDPKQDGFVGVWVTVTPKTENASIPLPRAVFIPHVPLNATIKQFKDLSVLTILNTLFGLMIQTVEIPKINYLQPTGPGAKDHARVPVTDFSKTIAEIADKSDIDDDHVIEIEEELDLENFLLRVQTDPLFSESAGIAAEFPAGSKA